MDLQSLLPTSLMTLSNSTLSGLDQALAAGVTPAEILRGLEDQLGIHRNSWQTYEPELADHLVLLGEVEAYLSAHAL